MPDSLQPSFTSGEWSPYLEDRPDLQKYRSGCKKLENFLLTPYGPIRRRPGLQYIATAQWPRDYPSVLVTFQFSATVGYVMEFSGGGEINFFKGGAKHTVSPAITHPYSETEIFEVQFAQINDVVYAVHPNHAVRKLSRVSDTNWTFAEVAYTAPPFRDENLDESETLTVSATTGTATMTSSSARFAATHVGSYWRIGHDLEESQLSFRIRRGDGVAGTIFSDPLKVRGQWELSTYGNWTGVLVLQKRVSGGAWTKVREWVSVDANRNFSATGVEEGDAVEYRFQFTDNGDESSAGDPQAVLELVESTHYGVVKVTGFTDAQTVTVSVITDLDRTDATFLWSEGSWSDFRGHPRTVSLHEQRLFFASNAAQAQTIWCSDVDDYDTFTSLNNEDSDSFQVTIGATEYNQIQWLATSPKNLMLGTTGGEWSLSSGTEELVMTPTNVRARRESVWGGAHLQAISTNNVILFVELGARKLRELAYSFEQDGFVSADLTQLSEHLTSGGIKDLAIQRHRDVTVWAVTGDGLLLSLAYDRAQDVAGWSRHTTDGTFESVTTVRTAGEEDEVWVTVKRTVDGGTTRYIERFYPEMWALQEAETQEELFHVDAGTFYNGASTTTITGLTHLKRKTVQILNNGAKEPDQEVSATGEITLKNPGTKVIVGLGYTSEATPLPWETEDREGVSHGKVKRIHEVVVNVYKSAPFKVGTSVTQDQVYFRDTSDPMDQPPPLKTDQIVKPLPRRQDKRVFVTIKQDDPLPLTVRSLTVKYTVKGD